MTAYVAISDADVDPESPITTTLMTRMRDNAISIGEADSTAPDTVKYGKLLGLTIITATNATWTPNAKTKKMIVRVVGGGGGGGSAFLQGYGFGGKAGADVVNVSSAVSGTYAATIGAGGAAASQGGSSSFIGTGLSITATGGYGAGGNYGSPSGGQSEAGESCVEVGGAPQTLADNNGNAAAANSGAGGGGAYNNALSVIGGAGGSGIIYVYEYT